MWEWPYYPQYYVPFADVADGVLQPSPVTSHSPSRGTATHYAVAAGGQRIDDGALVFHASPIEEIRGHVRFEFEAMDAWFEEDEEIIVHPRDPATRVQILPSSRHVTVSIDGTVVADTHRPTFLYETAPAAPHLHPQARRAPRPAQPDPHRVALPLQGHRRVLVGDHAPTARTRTSCGATRRRCRESMQIAGLMAFFDEKVDVTVDGVALPRPTTKFS